MCEKLEKGIREQIFFKVRNSFSKVKILIKSLKIKLRILKIHLNITETTRQRGSYGFRGAGFRIENSESSFPELRNFQALTLRILNP